MENDLLGIQVFCFLLIAAPDGLRVLPACPLEVSFELRHEIGVVVVSLHQLYKGGFLIAQTFHLLGPIITLMRQQLVLLCPLLQHHVAKEIERARRRSHGLQEFQERTLTFVPAHRETTLFVSTGVIVIDLAHLAARRIANRRRIALGTAQKAPKGVVGIESLTRHLHSHPLVAIERPLQLVPLVWTDRPVELCTYLLPIRPFFTDETAI